MLPHLGVWAEEHGKPVPLAKGHCRGAGVYDPPTLMVSLLFLKLHPRSHTICGQTEKLALELIAPSS